MRKTLSTGWLVVTLLAVSSAAALHAAQADEQAVREAISRSDWRQAREAATAWGNADSSNPVPSWLLAYASLTSGDYGGATELYSRLGGPQASEGLLEWAKTLAHEHPQSAEAQMLKGDALARSGEYDDALAALNEAVRFNPSSALIYDVRGPVKALAGKTESAIEDFDKAIELKPDFADAYVGRGLVRGRSGKVEDALSDLDHALELAPDHAVARNARAVILASVGRLEEAENDLRIAAQTGVGFATVAASLSALEWLDARERLKVELADRRGGVLRMEALSVYPGVGTENSWQPTANVAVDVLRQRTGRDAIIVPFRAVDELSYAQIRDTAHHAFVKAAREGKNLVPVIVPHLTIYGYLSPLGGADQARDLEFGKTATSAIHAGFLKAQQELVGAGQRVVLVHGALSHSWGTVVNTEAIENAHRQLGLRPFTGDLWYVAPRVGENRLGQLPKMGYSPAQINVVAIKGDAWARPGAAANVLFPKTRAGKDYNLHVMQEPVAGGLPPRTWDIQHNLPITNPRLNIEVESYSTGGQRNRVSTDFLGLVTGNQKVPDYWTFSTRPVTEAKSLASMAGRDVSGRVLVVGEKYDPRVSAMMSSLPPGVGIQVSLSDLNTLQRQAREYGAARIIGVKSLGDDDIKKYAPRPDFPRPNFEWLVIPPAVSGTKYGPPPPPDKFGGAGVPSYRLPSTTLPGEKRGGVTMKADVVKGEPADTSGIFGGEGAAVGTGSSAQQGIVCPFLLFCATP